MLRQKFNLPEKKTVLVLGSVSSVGRAIASGFALKGFSLVLGDIEREENERVAKDIQIRYNVECQPIFFDASQFSEHEQFLQRVEEALGEFPTGVVMSFGYMPVQGQAEKDFQLAQRTVEINYLGVISVLERVLAKFEQRGYGFAIVFSSVAGDRGRKSNYIYGSSKGALTRYLEGVQHRISGKNIHVMIVKPGFMDTAMTYGLNLPAKLMAQPNEVGRIVIKSWEKGRQEIYVKWFWRWIMLIIRHLPRFVFYKTNL